MNNQRKNIFRINQYQKDIVIIPLFTTLLLCAMGSFAILYIKNNVINFILRVTDLPFTHLVNQWSYFVILCLWIFFLFLMLWSIITSHNLVGAFERIMKELDDTIEGKRKGPLKVRKKDRLAQDLLQRINILIDRMS